MSPYKNPEDQKAHDRKKYREQRERLLEYGHLYYLTHKAEIKARYRLLHPKKPRNPKQPRNWTEHARKWRKANPEKLKAEVIARKHTVLRTICSLCGSTRNLQRHHPDYSKPLEVITICRKCHAKIHPRTY